MTVILSLHLLCQISSWKLFSIKNPGIFSFKAYFCYWYQNALHSTSLCYGTFGPPGSTSYGSSSPERWPPGGSRWEARRSRSPFHHRPADRPRPPRCPPPPERKHRHPQQIIPANLLLTHIIIQVRHIAKYVGGILWVFTSLLHFLALHCKLVIKLSLGPTCSRDKLQHPRPWPQKGNKMKENEEMSNFHVSDDMR